jgi:Amt family ammonium transporter
MVAAGSAFAQAAEPTVNKGDNAWMLISTVLVLLMTIPGLRLFYGGLVRSKNMLSVLGAGVLHRLHRVGALGALLATASASRRLGHHRRIVRKPS